VQREAQRRTPKVPKKARRARVLPKYLASRRDLVAPERPPAK